MRMQLIKGLGRLRDILRLIGEQVEKIETVILGSFLRQSLGEKNIS